MSQILFVVFMDRISRRSQGEERVWFGDIKNAFLLLADDIVLLAAPGCDFQHSLEYFAAKCAEMRVSTSKGSHDSG